MVISNKKIWKMDKIYSETIELMQSHDSNYISFDKGISINVFNSQVYPKPQDIFTSPFL